MKMIEITRYNRSMSSQWDEMAQQSRNGTFLHQRGYMDYHSDRFEDCSLVAWRNGKPCGLLPANIEGSTLWSHHGLTYGGWLLPFKHFDASIMIQVMDAAIDWMSANGINRLVYKPVPHIYHRYPCEEDLYAVFRHHGTLNESNISTTIIHKVHNPLTSSAKFLVNGTCSPVGQLDYSSFLQFVHCIISYLNPIFLLSVSVEAGPSEEGFALIVSINNCWLIGIFLYAATRAASLTIYAMSLEE